MRILMLGNSLTSAQDMPDILAELTGAEVVCHTRGGARLSEHLNPNTRLGARTQAALAKEQWDYVVLQEMSHGPITAPKSFFSSVERLCGQIRANGAVPVLFATWAYQKGGAKLAAKGATLAVIWVETSPEVVHQRMIERNSDRDTWKLAHWDEYLRRCNFAIPENLADPQHKDNLILFQNNNDDEFDASMKRCVAILEESLED